MIKIWTDGACSQNGNWKGGWGLVFQDEEKGIHFEYGSYDPETTNNIMELSAVNRALELGAETDRDVIIYTDSAYIVNCFKNKWYEKWELNGWLTAGKKPVANKELWENILKNYRKGSFTIVKVKGHSDNINNNRADEIAVMCKNLQKEYENYE